MRFCRRKVNSKVLELEVQRIEASLTGKEHIVEDEAHSFETGRFR